MLRILNAVFFAATIIVNGMADILPIAGVKTAEVSQRYQHLLSPANFAFVIWGLIYALMAVFVWYLFKHKETANKCGPWFIISCVANMAWIVLWHYQLLWLTLACMAVVTGAVLMMQERLKDERETIAQKLIVQGSVGLYFGWALVALAANAAACLMKSGVSPFTAGAQVAAGGALLGIALLTMYFLLRYGNAFFGAAVVWGLTGVLVEQFIHYRARYPLALAACAMMILFLLVRMWQQFEPMEALQKS